MTTRSRSRSTRRGYPPRVERLEPRIALAVTVLDPLPDVSISTADTRQSLPLTNRFDDTAVTGSVVRFATNLAAPFDRFFVELFDAPGPGRDRTTPVTAANFLQYVDAGRYTNTFVHRSVPGFVIQMGGYALTGGLPHIETFGQIQNEFGTSNTRGTIAMAKLGPDAPGGGPDSASSEWFVNLADNAAGPARLDTQNGGFTVFGRVLGSGMNLFDAIASQVNQYDIRAISGNGALNETPLIGIPNPVPATFQLSAGNFLSFPAVERSGELSLTVSSSDATLVAPSFVIGPQGPTLQLDHASGRAGAAVVTVRIASLFDPQNAVEDQFTVVIQQAPRPPTDILLSAAAVAENQPGGTTVGTLTSIDPDEGNTFTYTLVSGDGSADNGSFTIDGGVLKTAASFNFEARSSYFVRVRSTDQGGLFTEKAFTIAVTDITDEPLVIESITTPAAGSYKAGEIVTFTINLSEAATVKGRPQLDLRLGSAGRMATFVAGSGTARLAFQYRVGSKDDAEQVALGARLALSARNAITAGAERLNAALPAALANAVFSGLRFDAVPPRVSGRVQVPAAGRYGVGQPLDVVVTFSESVFVGGPGQPSIVLSGLSGGPRQAVYVSGSGTSRLTFRYVVQPGDAAVGRNGLSLGRVIAFNGGTITDRDGKNPAAARLPATSLRGVMVGTPAP